MSSSYSQETTDPRLGGVNPSSGLSGPGNTGESQAPATFESEVFGGQGGNTGKTSSGASQAPRDADVLRDSTYGHSKHDPSSRETSNLGNTQGNNPSSGIGHSSGQGDNYGRDTANLGTTRSLPSDRSGLGGTGMGNKSGMGTTEIGTGTHHSGHHGHGHEGNVSGDPTTGVNAGAGIHAQQYHGRGTAAGEGVDTTPIMSEGGGHHHQHGSEHHGAHEHGHPLGEGRKHGCSTCIGSTGGADQTKMTTSTGTSITEGQSPLNLKPGQAVVEKETRVHHGGPTAGSGQQSNLGSSQNTGQNVGTGTGATGGRERSFAEQDVQHGKPSLTDKIVGGAEKVAGKMTKNPEMVTRGAERAAGESEVSKN
ncbi:hypothetical protein BDZ97DRAFT_1813781 [Flammula alnicola]|nr:hypothetical protein BDZ97DRAFT_1813781 [Flammula alnicola]